MSEKQSSKILIISLDGATFDILSPLMQQGVLPNIQKYTESGISFTLESTDPPLTAPAWTTFLTGLHPGRHGLINFVNFSFSEKKDKLVNAGDIHVKTIFEILSEKGKQIISINLPMTYPPYPINGHLVSGFDTPSVEVNFTYPLNLKNEILALAPDYDFVPKIDEDRIYEETGFENLMDRFKKTLENRFRVAFHLIQNKEWDVFMIHFQLTDILQHLYWDYLVHPSINPSRTQKIYEIFCQLDAYIGILVNENDAHGTTFIMSDHGFGPIRGIININNIFIQKGYLQLNQTQFQKFKKTLNGTENPLVQYPINWVKKLRSLVKKTQSMSWHGALQKGLLGTPRNINWQETIACHLFGSQYGFVYLNTKRRWDLGIVEVNEYKEIRSHIINLLLMSKNGQGDHLFEKVFTRESLYDSDEESLPDIIAKPTSGLYISPNIDGRINYEECKDVLRGNHQKNGIFIAFGCSINSKTRRTSAHLINIPPTILHILGLHVPKYMQGEVLTDILTFERPVVFEGDSGNSQKLPGKSTDAEIEKIKERLKGIGYLS